jgi:hypothetical protein
LRTRDSLRDINKLLQSQQAERPGAGLPLSRGGHASGPKLQSLKGFAAPLPAGCREVSFDSVQDKPCPSQAQQHTTDYATLKEQVISQDSFDSFVSSMTMSLNSLDSKISPHSLHSTNSESSSRATICTRGCLHGAMLLFFSGSGDGEDGVINPGLGIPFVQPGISPEIGGILDRLFQLSSPSVDLYPGMVHLNTSGRPKLHGLKRLSPA